MAGPMWSPTTIAGGAGNATPPGRPAGLVVGAGVRPGPSPLGKALRWQAGPGDVTLVELALDCETILGRALPASPNHQLRGMRLPLGE